MKVAQIQIQLVASANETKEPRTLVRDTDRKWRAVDDKDPALYAFEIKLIAEVENALSKWGGSV